MRKLILAACLVLGATAIGLIVRARGPRPPVPPLHPVTDARLLAADSGGEWLTYGRDYGNRRFAPFTQINRQTVHRLQVLWHHGARGLISGLVKGYVKNESTPVVTDGMLIYTDPGVRAARPGNHVIAVDLRTGRELWSWYHKPNGMALCCGFANRGVGLYEDKVYVATLDAKLVALDRATGEVVWEQQVADPADGYSFTMAPLAAGGKILIGSSGGEFSIRGFVDAYDPATGRRLWRFWTIPSPEEGGWWGGLSTTTPDGDRLPRDTSQERRDSAAWSDAWRRGGGPVWTTPAYDAELGLIIFGVGNPSPSDGIVPPGDNLYTTSLVAVDIATGKLRWYHQMVPHNVWDYDPASPPVTMTVLHEGRRVPAVAQAGKTGWVYILDRRTGRQLRRSEPFVPMEHIFPAPTREGVRTAPSARGGSNWAAAAFSAKTGAMYVLGSYFPMRFKLDSAAGAQADEKSRRTGGFTGRHAAGYFEEFENDGRFGTVTAIDVATGTIRWQHKVRGHLMFGGALATAGDLVFVGEAPNLAALDAETGELVWHGEVENGVLGPPISFLVDGEQRVAVTSTRGVTVFGLR